MAAIELDDIEDFEASLLDATPTDAEAGEASETLLLEPERGDDGVAGAPGGGGGEGGAAPSSGSPMPDAGKSKQRWMGKRLSQFRLMRVLGSGTMGTVFLAEDVNLKRMTALKVLRKRIRGDGYAHQVERFMLEARTAASIEHPSIAHIYEINEHGGWWYIAMEFLEGGSLKDIVNSTGPLAPGRAAPMFAEAARGLQAAHDVGVVHRDVKPANLMLNRMGRCKVVDFGLVKLNSEEDPFRGDARFAGTPFFAAPEVIRQRREISGAADVYSLGASLYAVLTGRPPFRAGDLKAVLRHHLETEPPDVREASPGCPASMAELVLRMMSKDAEERPASSSVAAALQAETAALSASGDWARAGESTSGLSAAATPELAAGSGTIDDLAATAEGLPRGAGRSSPGVAPGETEARARRLGGPRTLWSIAAAAVLVVGAAAWVASTLGVSSGGVGEAFTNSAGMRMVPIPAGSFLMGSPADERGRNTDERQVRVRIDGPRLMSATEVTQSQWREVMGADYAPPGGVHPNERTGLRFLGPTLPAYVSWYEAAEFCRRLTVSEGRVYRLPTEAEWEYACRAGTTTAFNTGPALTPASANIDAETGEGAAAARRPMPVASFPPNGFGLHDMHGNVMEWCGDWRAEYPLGPLADPSGPSEGSIRVVRGGSWDSYARTARSANRWANHPAIRNDRTGFRVVLVPDAEPPAVSGSLLAAGATETSPSAAEDDEPRGVDVPIDPGLPAYAPGAQLDVRLRSVGSDTMDRLVRLWESRFQGAHPSVTVRHEGRGSSAALPALTEGLSHIGPMSRPLNTDEIAAFQTEHGYAPTQLVVAIDALAVYVHPENPVLSRGLTLRQLAGVFGEAPTGGAEATITSWGQLGLSGVWSAASITAYGRNSASGTYSVFKRGVLGGGAFARGVRPLVGSAELVESIAADRFGIGYSGIGYRTDRVTPVPIAARPGARAVSPTPPSTYAGDYPLARPLFLTIDHEPNGSLSDLEREFIRFVFSRDGQRLVASAGFYPLTAEMARAELSAVGLSLDGP